MAVSWRADLAAATLPAMGFGNWQRQTNAGVFTNEGTLTPPTVTGLGGRAGQALQISITTAQRRNEVVPNHADLEASDSCFFGVALRFPAGFPFAVDNWHIVDQLHQASGNWSPPVSFEVVGSNLRLDGGYGLANPANPSVGAHNQTLVSGIAADTWHSLVYRVQNFSASANVSTISVWWNGAAVLTDWTLPCPTLLTDPESGSTGTYRKCGIYRDVGDATTSPALTLYQAGHAAGATYAAADPTPTVAGDGLAFYPFFVA